MNHVFEGQPDELQSGDGIKLTRFRPRYRPLSEQEVALHDAIKQKAAELEELFELVPNGREKALSMTKLEEAVMWNVKALTA